MYILIVWKWFLDVFYWLCINILNVFINFFWVLGVGNGFMLMGFEVFGLLKNFLVFVILKLVNFMVLK